MLCSDASSGFILRLVQLDLDISGLYALRNEIQRPPKMSLGTATPTRWRRLQLGWAVAIRAVHAMASASANPGPTSPQNLALPRSPRDPLTPAWGRYH